MEDTDDLAALLRNVQKDSSFLAALWGSRRWLLGRAIERHASDVEAVTILFGVLDAEAESATYILGIDRHELDEARTTMQYLDETALVWPSSLLESPSMRLTLARLWLILEVRFPPEQRGWLADLRYRLTRVAEACEIDLRGLDV